MSCEHSDFRPVAFELGFGGKNGQLPAVTVTAGDTTLSVTGKVDRVDGWLQEREAISAGGGLQNREKGF